ncbi:hypothetical protein OO006_08480 [Prosthecochloris sp. SCSIO W1101]|uniref:hypothetical protein n=1 Tax=Prosthecochloris sp. SCSIO W1101 TaxID=2992242 RepID=UPI00223E73C8|nr:hypothetical protein [Prosthecochloris sp. SCSIO W1101]UZJ40402.1 hypothetical protein OO006_08480 [Prosthecochloris sp. SCSIO W1101]
MDPRVKPGDDERGEVKSFRVINNEYCTGERGVQSPKKVMRHLMRHPYWFSLKDGSPGQARG